MVESKVCSSCKIEKDACDFYKKGGRLHAQCKECHEETRKFRDVRVYGSGGFRQRYHKYGITKDQFEQMLVEQDGKCLICNKEKELVVDHCHKTGKVRGLLCRYCNVLLSKIEDDKWLAKAKEYLER